MNNFDSYKFQLYVEDKLGLSIKDAFACTKDAIRFFDGMKNVSRKHFEIFAIAWVKGFISQS